MEQGSPNYKFLIDRLLLEKNAFSRPHTVIDKHKRIFFKSNIHLITLSSQLTGQ
jgi:hypothetical protein